MIVLNGIEIEIDGDYCVYIDDMEIYSTLDGLNEENLRYINCEWKDEPIVEISTMQTTIKGKIKLMEIHELNADVILYLLKDGAYYRLEVRE